MAETHEAQSIDEALRQAARALQDKPPDDAKQQDKKRYSELMSAAMAIVFADELRRRGLADTLPRSDEGSVKGSERRMAGGIGAKKVDVTWATDESGLILAISIKTINFRDRKSNNYQKNLVNRRGDMLMEAVTLHRRFPYAVLGGIFFLDSGAGADATSKRRSTFANAHTRLQLFTGRDDPSGRDEQFERLYLSLIDVENNEQPFKFFEVGDQTEVPASKIIEDLLQIVAHRNPDLYEYESGHLVRQ
jgi:hypothetical protein